MTTEREPSTRARGIAYCTRRVLEGAKLKESDWPQPEWQVWSPRGTDFSVRYTTTSYVAGPLAGKFEVAVYLLGFANNHRGWQICYRRAFAKRKTAKAYAVRWYYRIKSGKRLPKPLLNQR